MQENLKQIDEAGEAAGLKTNIQKTKTMVFGQEAIKEKLWIGTHELKMSRSLCT